MPANANDAVIQRLRDQAAAADRALKSGVSVMKPHDMAMITSMAATMKAAADQLERQAERGNQ